MSNFYRAFEDKYRGSRDAILNRLRVYENLLSPWIQEYSDLSESLKALDLGCGRGEWIEVLQGHSFEVKGVDLDSQMLSVCREFGYDVEHADLFVYLENVEDSSLDLLSSFHVIEHLSFEQLQQLILQAKRVLKPGGLLILETPNPENISVSSTSFYLDPTHNRPIPPGLLGFLANYYDYELSMIYRLDNYKSFKPDDSITLRDVLQFSSPDYALVALKGGHPGLTQSLKLLFQEELYGHSFDKLLSRWDSQQYEIKKQIERIEQSYIFRAEWFLRNFYKQQVNALFEFSFKRSITSIKKLIKSLIIGFRSFSKNILKSALWRLKHKIHKFPNLQRKLIRFLERFPVFSVRIRRLMHSVGSDSQIQDVKSPEELSSRSASLYMQMRHMQRHHSKEN